MLITDAGAPLRSSDPLYFMLRPESRAARQMQRVGSQLRAENKSAGRLLEETRLHVTLLFLCSFGQLTRETFTTIHQAAATVAMPVFLAGFDWAVSFGKRQQSAAGFTRLRHSSRGNAAATRACCRNEADRTSERYRGLHAACDPAARHIAHR